LKTHHLRPKWRGPFSTRCGDSIRSKTNRRFAESMRVFERGALMLSKTLTRPPRFSGKSCNEFYTLALKVGRALLFAQTVGRKSIGARVSTAWQRKTGRSMFFPIRCIFWLAIVYSAIFSQDQARRTAMVVEMSQAAQSVIAKVLGHAQTRLAEHCAHQPSECLSLAEKITTLGRDAARGEAFAVATAPLPPTRRNGQAMTEHASADHLPRIEDLRLHTLRPDN
jgi:hypothetical protein